MKLKQFSKKSVSILLAIMMIISAISVGTFTTTAADVTPADTTPTDAAVTEIQEDVPTYDASVNTAAVGVGASNGKFSKGDTLYYDFSACTGVTGANYHNGENANSYEGSIPSNKVLAVTLKADFDVKAWATDSSKDKRLFATNLNWNSDSNRIIENKYPKDGDNCVKVNASGEGYEWTVYNSSGGGGGTGGDDDKHDFYYTGQDIENFGTNFEKMTESSDGLYAYHYKSTTGTAQFYVSANMVEYKRDYVQPKFNNTDIADMGGWNDNGNAYIWDTRPCYIIVYYPNTTVNSTNNPIICASTYLPNSSSESYIVTITNGISTTNNGTLGTGSFSRTSTTTTITKNRETDSFRTQFYTTVDDKFTEGDKNGLKYQVYGYSILITKTDGTQEVKSVTAAAGQVSQLTTGLFTAAYTFPEDISSAVITPVYVTSDDYNNATGIYLTTVYVKYTPGDDNFFNGVLEPNYYVWRGDEKAGDTVKKKNVAGVEKSFDREPTGSFPGQKLLCVGDDTYMAVVESYLESITFVGDGTRQTYDFDEFVRLQKLGYNNITFEPQKNNGNNIAKAIETAKKSKGNYIYSSSETVSITDSYLNSEFQLYKNLNGDYIDVFGNPLKRTTALNGSTYINEDDSDVKGLTGSTLLNKILNLVGKSSTDVLYGARYGYSDDTYSTNSTFGMNYPIRVYYFTKSASNTANMVAQMISGYGTIEYNYYKKGTTTTNAARYTGSNASANALADGVIGIDWGYYTGTSTTKKDFTATPYSIIPSTYVNTPYLVSYASQTEKNGYYRVDGRWYYTKDITQFDITVKVGTMDGKTFNEDDAVGTAKIDGKETKTAKVEQGKNALISVAAKNGYKFVGYYDTKGNRIDAVNGADYDLLVVSDTEIHAVFEKLAEGTLVVRNDIFKDKKAYSIGDGVTGVEIKVYDQNGSLKKTYGSPTSEEAATDTLLETDYYQIILYGKANGDDTFVRFLAAALSIYGGESDYTVLDEEDIDNAGIGLKKVDGNGDENPTYIYTFDKVKWQTIVKAFGTESISLQYYTDIARASNLATLTYQYLDRFNQIQTYVVSNVKLTDAEINGTLTTDEALDSTNPNRKYCPSKSTVLANAPEIDDLYKDCQWVCTDADENLELGTAEVYLVAVQTPKPVKTWIKYYDTEKGYFDSEMLTSDTNPDGKLYYNDLAYISTPESYTDEEGEHTFSFWKQFDVNEMGQPVDRADGQTVITDTDDSTYGAIFSTFSSVGIRMTVDKIYVACYDIEDTTGTDFNIEMRDAVYTREKYTDDNTGEVFDYVYADFSLQFTVFNQKGNTFGKLTFKDLVKKANANGNEGYNNYRNIRFGVLSIATDYSYDPSMTPQVDTNIKEAAIQGMINDNLDKPDGDFTTGVYLSEENGNYVYLNRNLNDMVDDLTILGRYNYGIKFTNSDYYQSIVFTVYSYICYEEKNDNGVWETKYELSKPRALSIYAAGTQNANTELN